MRINHQAVRSQQYAMTHNWNFILVKMPTGLTGFSGLVGENGVLNLHCETSSLPNAVLNMAEGKIRGIRVTQPGDTAPDGTFVASFFEKDDYSLSKFFDSWRQLGSHRTKGTQYPKSQSMVFDGCKMELLNGEGTIVGLYQPMNIIPINVALTDLSGDSDFQRLTVDFSYTTFDRVDDADNVVGGSDRTILA